MRLRSLLRSTMAVVIPKLLPHSPPISHLLVSSFLLFFHRLLSPEGCLGSSLGLVLFIPFDRELPIPSLLSYRLEKS